MQEPSVRTSRLAIAGGLAAVIAVGAVGFVIGRASVAPEPVPVPAAPPPATPPPPVEPVERTPPVLARADIIKLADAAADASASGIPLPASVTGMVGRRFTLYMPFGCSGPAGEESHMPFRWRYDAARSTLRLQIASFRWQPEDWWPEETAPKLEAIEGFWINRPWTSGETCPDGGAVASSANAEPVTLPGQTLAIAQFFSAGTSRQALRQGEPFEAVLRVPPEQLRTESGFRLRLTGRIDRVPGDGPVRCVQPAGIEQRPICVIAASLDELAIENPETGKTLATWTFGRSGPGNG